MKNFTPAPGKITIRPIKRETPIKTQADQFEEMGEVLEVGENTFVEPGDIVFFRPFAMTKTAEHEGERVYIVDMWSGGILGKVKHVPGK